MIRTWFEGLDGREKRLLIVGGLFAAIALLFLLWRPLAAARIDLQEQVERKQALVGWMSGAAAEIRQLQPGGADSSSSGMSLKQRIDAWSARLQLDTNVFPADGGAIRVKIDDTAFDPVLDFLEQAGRDGVQVTAAEIRALSAPGRVSVSLTLSP